MKMKVLMRLISMVVCAATAMAGDLVDVAKGVVASHADAVVRISAVAKITAEGQMAAMLGGMANREEKIEVRGTVIDATGLTVASLTHLDPTSAVGEIKIPMGGQNQTLKFTSDLVTLKIILADGSEIDAQIVLRDEDLDLAFIAPRQPLGQTQQVTPLDLTQSASDADVLDSLVALDRLPVRMNLAPSVTLPRITAKVTKPRTFYLVDATPGTPAFAADGKVLGICVKRRAVPKGAADFMSMGRAMSGEDFVPVILPAEDVHEMAEQARAQLQKWYAEGAAESTEPDPESPQE